MTNVTRVDFGSEAMRSRAKLADFLEEMAGYIRTNALEQEPHGLILMLYSDQNPQGFEVLNRELTAAELRAAVPALSRHLNTILVKGDTP